MVRIAIFLIISNYSEHRYDYLLYISLKFYSNIKWTYRELSIEITSFLYFAVKDWVYRNRSGQAICNIQYFHNRFDTFRTEKPQSIDLDYVKKAINRYFSLIRDTLNGTYLSKAEKDRQLHIARQKTIAQLEETFERQQQKEGEEIIKEQISHMDDDIKYNDVLGRIKSMFGDDYAEHTIKHLYDLHIAKHPEDSPMAIAKEISKKLVRGNTNRRSTTKIKTGESIKTDAMASFAKSYEGDPNDPI